MKSYSCLCCGSGQFGKSITVVEMMFGTRDAFKYVECAECESVQLDNSLPNLDMSVYYPKDYYSFTPRKSPAKRTLIDELKLRRVRHAFGDENLLGAMLLLAKPLPEILLGLKGAGAKLVSKILDVGSGGGDFLDELSEIGFTDLRGIDPFINQDITTDSGIKISKLGLEEVEGEFDIIMFNHALEHVPDPVATLSEVRKRLNPNGRCIVRIPTTSSDAWDEYQENWVQLDPPRHIFVPSRLGMKMMGQRVGMKLAQTIDDSHALQFWGSEMYRRNVSLTRNGLEGPLFTAEEMEAFRKRAKSMNRMHRGDQAAFVFER